MELEKENTQPAVWEAYFQLAVHKTKETQDTTYVIDAYERATEYIDDGIIANQEKFEKDLVISEMKKEGVSVSQLIAQIATYANSGEINFRIEKKKEAMEAMKEHFMAQEKCTQYMDFDGYRIEFSQWWFNIRPSNTEPYLRLLMEAQTKLLLDAKLKEARQILENYM